jgi:hypothetical protein
MGFENVYYLQIARVHLTITISDLSFVFLHEISLHVNQML